LLAGKEYTKDNNSSYRRANYIATMPGALGTLRVELKQGRYFDSSDNGLEKKTALVSENLATLHFKDESPLRKKIRLSDDDPVVWVTIVGVVENTIQGSREDKHIPTIFRPFTQDPRQQLTVAMLTNADVAKAKDTLRQTLMSIDPQLPSFQIETYEKIKHVLLHQYNLSAASFPYSLLLPAGYMLLWLILSVKEPTKSVLNVL
jgi:hypothetical protein